MLPNIAALKIQKFFKNYSSAKNAYLEELVHSHPAQELLSALNLRFKCMKIVAAAKFSIQKPIEDKTQISKVINSLIFLAKEQGINSIDGVTNLCLSNITIAENIQKLYCYKIWTQSYYQPINFLLLLKKSHEELSLIIENNSLPMLSNKKDIYLPDEVLGLAREIIQHATKQLLISLTDTRIKNYLFQNNLKFIETISEILSNYMTPTELKKNKKSIENLAESISLVIR